ncbi:unnamed protein product, partial [Vitis vinifera]
MVLGTAFLIPKWATASTNLLCSWGVHTRRGRFRVRAGSSPAAPDPKSPESNSGAELGWEGGGGRGSRWILFSSFQLLLRGTVADAFLMIFMVLFFRDLGVLYFESECFYHFYSPPRPPTLRSLSCLAIPKCFCCSRSARDKCAILLS